MLFNTFTFGRWPVAFDALFALMWSNGSGGGEFGGGGEWEGFGFVWLWFGLASGFEYAALFRLSDIFAKLHIYLIVYFVTAFLTKTVTKKGHICQKLCIRVRKLSVWSMYNYDIGEPCKTFRTSQFMQISLLHFKYLFHPANMTNFQCTHNPLIRLGCGGGAAESTLQI